MIAIITESQKNILIGQTFDGVQFFNPVQDANGNWVISEEEYYYCLGLWYLDELDSTFQFIITLSLSEYVPPIIENPFV
ncbi:hypothetical protein UFOVP206_16 [uncultured Caudovirales phage]|uniref:Uncharacterized protein n=1 Tax=uncultured Caudovirales phage TaxID=2100421 RepID=A0A6J7WNS9_9CAUD|nr:hypothetical protein UFOVP206_16 [uncultured Caudovirales phage]